jgi:hypothetical protein
LPAHEFPERPDLRLDRLGLGPEDLVDEPGIVGQAARARHAIRAGVGPGNDLLEDLVGVPSRGDEGDVREHIELPHDAGPAYGVPLWLGDELLSEQRGGVGPTRRQGRGVQVEFEEFPRAVVLAAGLQQFGA